MDSAGLDDITLTPALAHNLYPNGITNPDATGRKQVPPVTFKGENKQHVLVAVDVTGDLKTQDQVLLDNLLKACHLAMDDIALVNIRDQEATVPDIITQLKPVKCIFFGVPSLSINLPLGEAEESVIIYDDKLFIKTSPLSALQNQVSKKKALWSALKNMFDL